MVHAELPQHAFLDEKMNVLVNRCEGDGGYTLLNARIDLFRAGVARHRLHDLVENLPLVRRGEPVIPADFKERTGLNAGGGQHQKLVNDNYSCSSSGSHSLQLPGKVARASWAPPGSESGSNLVYGRRRLPYS